MKHPPLRRPRSKSRKVGGVVLPPSFLNSQPTSSNILSPAVDADEWRRAQARRLATLLGGRLKYPTDPTDRVALLEQALVTVASEHLVGFKINSQPNGAPRKWTDSVRVRVLRELDRIAQDHPNETFDSHAKRLAPSGIAPITSNFATFKNQVRLAKSWLEEKRRALEERIINIERRFIDRGGTVPSRPRHRRGSLAAYEEAGDYRAWLLGRLRAFNRSPTKRR